MGRRKLQSMQDYSRALKSGYGVGKGADYTPWLRVKDVSSKGRSSKLPGIKAARTHHLLSQHELNFFLLAEFNPSVIDIREQFPLLPLDLVVRLASEADLPYPFNKVSKDPYILSTDFLLTLQIKAEESFLAVAVKEASELGDQKVRERLEIERLWYECLGVPWRLVTDEQLDKQVGKNLEWFSDPLRGIKGIDLGKELSEEKIVEICSHLEPGKYMWSGLIDSLAFSLKLDPRYVCSLLKVAVWYRYIIVNLADPIQEQDVINILSVSDSRQVERCNDSIAS